MVIVCMQLYLSLLTFTRHLLSVIGFDLLSLFLGSLQHATLFYQPHVLYHCQPTNHERVQMHSLAAHLV